MFSLLNLPHHELRLVIYEVTGLADLCKLAAVFPDVARDFANYPSLCKRMQKDEGTSLEDQWSASGRPQDVVALKILSIYFDSLIESGRSSPIPIDQWDALFFNAMTRQSARSTRPST